MWCYAMAVLLSVPGQTGNLFSVLDQVTPAEVRKLQLTHANFEKIQFGMKRDEVVKILGGEPLTTIPEPTVFDFYGTLSSLEIQQNGELWESGTIRIWVEFDAEDRVTGKMMQ